MQSSYRCCSIEVLIMSDVKWIKIVTDIFDDEKMFAIETLPDGLIIELVWFKILCLAGKCNSNGFLTINGKLAYTDDMLSKVFRIDIGVVQRALTIFQELEMIEIVENNYMVANWLKYQSGDKLEDIRAKGAARQKKYREKQKQLRLEQKEDEDRNVTHNVTDNITVTQNCSYIYNSSFSNIKNLESLLSNNDYKNSIYILNNNILHECLKDWMEYKDECKPKGEHHYTEKGMKKTLTEVVNYDKGYGTDAVIKQIDHAIASQWKGMNLENLDRYGKKVERDNADTGESVGKIKWQ